MPHAFSRRLSQGPILCAGAMGTVPDPVRARLGEARDRALPAGIELAQSLVHEVRRRYAGAYLMPSFGRFEVVAEVIHEHEC